MSYLICRKCDAPQVTSEELDVCRTPATRSRRPSDRVIRFVVSGFVLTGAAALLAVLVGGVVRLWQWAV